MAISRRQCRLEYRYQVHGRMPLSQGSHGVSGGRDDDHRRRLSAVAMGTKWIGTDGWVWVDRDGFDASNPEWVKGDNLPEDLRKVKLYESSRHRRNFLDSVNRASPPSLRCEAAHHSTIPGHLGLISMLVGRKIHWDVKEEKIADDSGASELLSRPYRDPWHLA